MPKDIPKEEIEKWLGKIEPIVDQIKILDPKGEPMLTNLKAYISDSKHLLKIGDHMRSFEAVIWAWAIYEICLELGIFDK